MTLENLKRVMARLRLIAKKPRGNTWKINQSDLRKAIIMERGHSMSTYYNIKKALIDIGWLRTAKTKFIITGLDLTEDFDYGRQDSAWDNRDTGDNNPGRGSVDEWD